MQNAMTAKESQKRVSLLGKTNSKVTETLHCKVVLSWPCMTACRVNSYAVLCFLKEKETWPEYDDIIDDSTY